MNEREHYRLLDKYHAAIYYSKRDVNEFERRFGESIAEYKQTQDFREAHRIVQGFGRR